MMLGKLNLLLLDRVANVTPGTCVELAVPIIELSGVDTQENTTVGVQLTG